MLYASFSTTNGRRCRLVERANDAGWTARVVEENEEKRRLGPTARLMPTSAHRPSQTNRPPWARRSLRIQGATLGFFRDCSGLEEPEYGEGIGRPSLRFY